MRIKSAPKVTVTCLSCLLITNESGDTFSAPQDGHSCSFSKRQFLIPDKSKEVLFKNTFFTGLKYKKKTNYQKKGQYYCHKKNWKKQERIACIADLTKLSQ